MGDVLNQPGCVEASQGLSDRHRAHPERVPQLLDRQAFAGRQMTGDDRVVKRRERPVGQRAVAFDDPGCGEPPQSAGHLSSRGRTR